MTDHLFPLEKPTTDVEFVGFGGGCTVEPVRAGEDRNRQAVPAIAKPAVAKPRRRAKKAPKRVAVRIWFEERELLKLNGRAAEAGVALPEYLRWRALRDPRVRARPSEPLRNDLFARAEIIQTTTVVRLNAPLPPEMEERITTYFSPTEGLGPQSPREGGMLGPVARPMMLGRLAQLLTVCIAALRPGHRAIPPAGA
jgi:hypothetical protein